MSTRLSVSAARTPVAELLMVVLAALLVPRSVHLLLQVLM